MNTWAPLWSSIIDSSVWREPYHVRLLWLTMLAIKDADHVVRADPYKLANKAQISEKEAIEALDVLMAPDVRRISKQAFDGRRIEAVEDGWLILNGEKYRNLMTKMAERNRKARWARENRAKKKARNGKPQAGESGFIAAVERGAEEVELSRISDNSFNGYQEAGI